MILIKFAFALWVFLIVFYTLYLAAINLWDNRTEAGKWIIAIGSPIILVMIAFDVLLQVTVFTVLFADLPRDAMVTARLKRYRALAVPTWRTKIAVLICTKMLNPFDPTKHHC